MKRISFLLPALTCLMCASTYAQTTQVPWAAGKAFKAGDVVIHKGRIYRCRMAHTSIASWAPDVAPSLWEDLGPASTDTQAPAVSLKSSATTVTQAGNLTLTATASDNVGVSKVTFYDGTKVLATVTAAPHVCTVKLTAADNGTHAYSAKAWDTANNVGTSATVNVSVAIQGGDTQAPKVSLVADPVNITSDATLTLTASATDDVGIARVVILDGSTEIATLSAPPYVHRIAVTKALNGTRSYVAKAYDASGNLGTSVPVRVTVTIPDGGIPGEVEPSFMSYTDNGKKSLAINANHEYLGPDGKPFGVTTGGTLRTFKSIGDLIDREQYKALFPMLHGIPVDYGTWKDSSVSYGKDLYTYDNLVKAASYYPDFANHGSRHDRLRELAACLSNYAHETTGGWGPFSMGSNRYKYGLFFAEEVSGGVSCDQAGCQDYCVADATWGYACNIPPQPYGNGKDVKPKYHGRGPIQLSYNFNYGLMSEQLQIAGPNGKMDGLLYQPWLITRDGVLAFRSGFWFWMTPQSPKPSCHDVMAQRWKPSAADVAANRVAGLGLTINIINGGAECDQPLKDQVRDRIGYYLTILAMLGGTNPDGTLKVNPKAGGSTTDGSYTAGEPANPNADYCMDCVNMRRY